MFSSNEISYYIISLGCAKNQVDSERINGALASAGYNPVEASEDADIIIINTCGFITAAKEESISVIFEALDQQKAGGSRRKKKFYNEGSFCVKDFSRRVVVIGCLSERYRDALANDIPEIDLIYGLPDERFTAVMGRRFMISSRPAHYSREPLVGGLGYAYIKISEGCSNNCAYCAIPIIRGRLVPYSPDFILDDVRREAARGVKEMIIVAQDISAYRYEGTDLPRLVRAVGGIDGVEWIRLMYCHPDHVNDELMGIIRHEHAVVPYIDIPFQHANGRILRSMGRRGNADVYRALVERMRERVPEIRIRSTFMVGYPGETDVEFEELLRFLEEARLDRVGAFTYSPEEGTRAWDLGDPVPERLKKKRYERLMELQRGISADKLEGMAGKSVRVLVEEKVDETTWAGRTEYDAPEVDGIFYLTGFSGAINTIVTARVTGTLDYDLFGEVVP